MHTHVYIKDERNRRVIARTALNLPHAEARAYLDGVRAGAHAVNKEIGSPYYQVIAFGLPSEDFFIPNLERRRKVFVGMDAKHEANEYFTQLKDSGYQAIYLWKVKLWIGFRDYHETEFLEEFFTEEYERIMLLRARDCEYFLATTRHEYTEEWWE